MSGVTKRRQLPATAKKKADKTRYEIASGGEGERTVKLLDSSGSPSTGRGSEDGRKVQGLERIQVASSVKAATEKNDNGDKIRVLNFAISTGAVDRHGDTVNPKGWKLDNYKANPVVLFGHDHGSPPIAKCNNVYSSKGVLRAKAEFLEEGMFPFSDMIYAMYEKGFLSATSVGFQPLEWEWAIPSEDLDDYMENPERYERGPLDIDFIKQELLEFSAVTVPANPEALIGAKDAGINIDAAKEWAERTLDMWPVHERSGLAVPRQQVEDLYKTAKEATGGHSYSTSSDHSHPDGGNGDHSHDKDSGQDVEDPHQHSYNSDGGEEPDEATTLTLEEAKEQVKDGLTGETPILDEDWAAIEACYHENGLELPPAKYFDMEVLANFPEAFQFDYETGNVAVATEEASSAEAEEGTSDDSGDEGSGGDAGSGEGDSSSDDVDYPEKSGDAADESEEEDPEGADNVFTQAQEEAIQKVAAEKLADQISGAVMEALNPVVERVKQLEDKVEELSDEPTEQEIASMIQNSVSETISKQTGRSVS